MALPQLAIWVSSVSGVGFCSWTDQYWLRPVVTGLQVMTSDWSEDAHSPVMSAYT
jgi:hypothetical protein